jgi:hypothetical protein
MIFGVDFLLINRRKANVKGSIVISGTISICTALVLAHVNKQVYTFPIEPSLHFIFKAPEKKTPVTVNGGPPSILSFGNVGALET